MKGCVNEDEGSIVKKLKRKNYPDAEALRKDYRQITPLMCDPKEGRDQAVF